MPNRNDLEYSQSIITPLASMNFMLQDNQEKVFHGLWYKCNHAAVAIVDVIKLMSMQMISLLSPTASSSLWLAGVILTLQAAITQDKKEKDTLLSSITFLLNVIKRLGRTWPAANALHGMIRT